MSEQSNLSENSELNSALQSLVRGTANDLSAYICELGPATTVDGTLTTVRAYHVALDAQGQSRLRDFAKRVARRVIDYAIPRNKITEAQARDLQAGSTESVEALSQEAHALFTTAPNSGEGGEVLLSTLVEFVLGFPQLFTKMDLKTNRQVHAHGSDGIHATVSSDGALALCWGESKLHSGDYSAVDECLESIAPYLLDEGGTDDRRHRDLVLLRDGLALRDPALVEAIKRFLNPDDVLFLKLEHRGVCLVGYNSPSYVGEASTNTDLCSALQASVTRVNNRVRQQVQANGLEARTLDIFHIPLPAVQEFRDAFRAEMRLT